MNKKSFLMHIDSLAVIDDLTDEQCGELFRAIKSYHYGEELELSPLVKIAFSPFKNQFIRDHEKYIKTCEARAIAGSKGGKQKVANASKRNQKVANLADNDNKKDNDSDNDNKKKRFKPPSLQEVQQYITENNFNIDAGQFIDFYESKGWMVGKNKMKSWEAACRTWSKRGNHETHNRAPKLTAIERVRQSGNSAIDITAHTKIVGKDDDDIWS